MAVDQPRSLTARETAVLAHVVVDPVAWFAHCAAHAKTDTETSLAAKVARWAPEYDAQKDVSGYKTRAVRQAEEDAG